MKRVVPWIALACAGAAFAACNSSNNSTPGPCGSPPGVSQTVLVYPAPGSTGIPDSVGQVIVGMTATPPPGWGVTVVSAIGTGTNGSAFTTAPSPLPSPNQTPAFPNPVYQSSAITNFSVAGSTVAAYLNNLNTNCIPSVQIGSFTTQ